MSESMPEPDHWSNLLWAVSTEDISRDKELPWLPPQRRTQLAEYFSREEVHERLAPMLDSGLRRKDEYQKTARLGVYFENLWEFAFAHHPDYKLLARNLPLRDAGRTLGELDFVVHHLPSGATEHWEIAVKFYLQVGSKHWVGPGLRDRLDIKLARMREHQLPVSRQPLVQQLLAQQDIQSERQWALMPGRLFRPLCGNLPPLLPDINPGSTAYWWATGADFLQTYTDQPYRWAILPKRAWLADRGYRSDNSDLPEPLADRLQRENRPHPVCVAALDGGREVNRGFIVPDGWYPAARAQL